MKCPYCSFDNADNATHCKVCGNALKPETPAPEAPLEDQEKVSPDSDPLEESPQPQKIEEDLSEDPFFESLDHEEELDEGYHLDDKGRKQIIIVGSIIVLLLLAFFLKNMLSTSNNAPAKEANETITTEPVVIDVADTEEETPAGDTSSEDQDSLTEETSEETAPVWPPATLPTTETSNTVDTSAPSRPATETAAPLVGFLSTGSFDGGDSTSQKELSGLRHGLHPNFERLVIDFTTDQVPAYTTSIDSSEILINLTNIEQYQGQLPEIGSNSDIKSLDLIYGQNMKDAVLKISLKNPDRAYKVFSLKAPGRIVIDID